MKETIGYKVVAQDGRGHYTSAVIREGVWRHIYPIDERVVGREGTKLLAFRRLADAKDFADAFSLRRVFRASLENPRTTKGVLDLFQRGLFRRFWRLASDCDWPSVVRAPRGTVACDAITLLREV